MGSAAVSTRRQELRNATRMLQERCQYESAAWAAELMAGLPAEEDSVAQEHTGAFICPSGTQAQEDTYLLAKSIFDMREYRRAAHILRGADNDKSIFLRCYALYLAGEKRQEEERIELSGVLGTAQTVNEDLTEIEAILRRWLLRSNDALCYYLLGVVLCDREQLGDARKLLLQSINLFPCHWSAWKAYLVASGGADAPIADPDLPQHWMREIYFSSLCLESRENEEGLGRLQALQQEFPQSDWVLMQAAIAQYHLRNFDASEAIFQDILSRDPHCIKGMDEYSNILYVKESPALLSHLAHRVAVDDKYRPESCCIMGNYYSLNTNHEKAVTYFQRAIKLDRKYLNAWTLMGHEYVEMKNPTAAIDAYRRATSLNQNDYRAWYGLGQTYELLQMPFYAVHYYKRALQLRPNDARMWVAMGQCLENDQLQLTEKAIGCYHKAIKFGDREGIALHKLGMLYESLSQDEEAAHYFQQNLDRIDAIKASGSDQQIALFALANYKKEKGDWISAENYCLRLLDMGGPHKEKAKALLREIRSLAAQRS